MTLPIQLPDFEGRAACAEVGGDDWFPDKGGSVREAKSVCGRCEIVEQCLLWALSNNELFGVWGGLTFRERSRLQRKRRVQPIKHGTAGGYEAHRRRGEKSCESCLLAKSRINRDDRARKAGAA